MEFRDLVALATQEILHPPEYQVESLGLNLERLRGKRVLDIGCGPTAELVYYLNSAGILADGIDPKLICSASCLIKMLIEKESPEPGCIPKEDRSYDLVVAHTVPAFEYGFSGYIALARRMEIMGITGMLAMARREIVRGQMVLSEALRVMKDNGRLVVYGSLDKLGEVGQELSSRGYVIAREPVYRTYNPDGEAPFNAVIQELGLDQQLVDCTKHRTVISRKK